MDRMEIKRVTYQYFEAVATMRDIVGLINSDNINDRMHLRADRFVQLSKECEISYQVKVRDSSQYPIQLEMQIDEVQFFCVLDVREAVQLGIFATPGDACGYVLSHQNLDKAEEEVTF